MQATRIQHLKIELLGELCKARFFQVMMDLFYRYFLRMIFGLPADLKAEAPR
jgi:hypothetical protein